MKKIGYIAVTFAQVALLFGTFVIHYFTRKKMGMARYVIYKNQGWERDYPMQMLKVSAIAVIVLLTLLVIIFAVRRKERLKKMQVLLCAGMVFADILYIVYTVCWSTEKMRDYYFISAMLSLAALIQIIKTAAGIWLNGRTDEK